MGRQITEGCKKTLVTFFSYTVWPSAVKFGSVGGRANRHLFPEFGELRSWVPAIPCGDMHQFFTDALVIIIRPHRSTTYVDAAYCYRQSSVVCRFVGPSVCHSNEPCINNSANQDAVCVKDSGGHMKPCIRWRFSSPMGRGNFKGENGRPVIKYSGSLP